MGDIMEQVKKSQMIISESINKINTTQLTVASAVDSIVLSNRSQDVTLSAIKESNKTIQKNTLEVSDNTRHLGEILDVLSGMGGGQEEMISQVSKIKDIIHDEVLQIEEDMEKTSKLLERKFDEFTDLLKKSNTEALVEVMTRVTEEFQKQMNSLINRLIQENFDQLNNSVEKLNQWQQENKEMIVSLTRQYKEMSNNFATGSSELTPRFKEILDEFLPRYFNILLKDSLRINIQEIRIEGHTDDVPIPRYDSDPYVANAKLSQERALSVLKYFRTMPTFSSYSNIQKQLLEYWLTANGLSYGKALDMDGDFVIVTGKDIDRAHSRRVEFRIVTSGDDILENFVKQNSNK